jgi:hypothetical protein
LIRQNESPNLEDWAFLILDFFENIQSYFLNNHFCISAIQSIVFGTIQGFNSAVENSEKDSGDFGFPNVGLVKNVEFHSLRV